MAALKADPLVVRKVDLKADEKVALWVVQMADHLAGLSVASRAAQ